MKQSALKAFSLIAVFLLLFGCKKKVKEVKVEKVEDIITVKGTDGKKYTSYRTACSNGDFDAAREYIDEMKLFWGNSNSVREAEEYVDNEEIQFLVSLNEEQANNRVILILNKDVVEGLEAQEGACLGKRVRKFDLENESYGLGPQEVTSYRKYISWCGEHNSKCSKVLSIAISCGNENLAKKLIHQFKSDPELVLKNEKKGEYDDYYYDVYAHYTNGSINAARKKYDEAVKSGAFK